MHNLSTVERTDVVQAIRSVQHHQKWDLLVDFVRETSSTLKVTVESVKREALLTGMENVFPFGKNLNKNLLISDFI